MLPTPPRSTPTSIWPAIVQVLVGVLLFSCSDAMSKYLRQHDLSAIEIGWLRYVVFVLLGLFIASRRQFVGLRSKRPLLQVLRGVTLLASAILFITGLSYLPMAEASALSFVSPAFITALSVLLLGEQVGLHRWAATALGLVGVLIVIRPGSDALQLAALYPIGSAACWAVAMIATRMIGAQDRSKSTLLWSASVGLVLLTLGLPFGFVVPTLGEIGLGVCLGLAASIGQYLLIIAYRRATASLLAPFSYLQLLCSGALGYFVFGSVPDSWAYAGAAVIIGSGLYIVHRERVRAQQALKMATPETRAAATAKS